MANSKTLIEPVSAHSVVTKEIEDNLLASLAGLNAQSTNATIVLSRRDPVGKLVAGVSGSTSYGWYLVKLLWVHEDLRGTGIGKTLMLEAEERARALGCHSAWLDTSNREAREFYLRIGYSEFGSLSNPPGNDPEGHCRWFMEKAL
ncbi:GNAT family N-acetyltransferase [uncultured Ruegeria sp.]|uniref:GNAT family N-acetyltransferase n=1 Tax=uncultured Ruegeria sp. TaxID=259304 RepID=UPI00262911E1|nr:GNAT family N-acetyltransferase [uncultured Ruegeria sp.]